MSLGAADRSRIAEIERSLRVYVDGEPPGLTQVLAPVRDLLRFDPVIAYGVEEVGESFRLSFAEAVGGCGTSVARRVLGDFIGAQSRKFAGYDPRRPEPWNRNKVVTHADLIRHGVPTAPITEIAMPKLGVVVSQQLRVLVCDGPSLLAWFGGYRSEPFTQRDRRVLGALVPSVRRRLMLERTLASAGLTHAALEVALEAIGAPTFLLAAGGAPVLANAAGRAALDTEPVALRAKLTRAARSRQDEEFRVFPVDSPGSPRRFLAIGKATPSARVHVQNAARLWGLSRRQADVLTWVLEGASNARIGAELGIADRTVETHVTAILERAQVDSRAELIVAAMRT